jgi:hypothetical protein
MMGSDLTPGGLLHPKAEGGLFEGEMRKVELHLFGKPLAPSDPYMVRTAPLTSRSFILNIYSTNIRTENFKHAA